MATKQEEIISGVIQIAKSRPMAFQLIKYLHSKGVVIKVERELPTVSWNSTRETVPSQVEIISRAFREAYEEAGYVAVEPLIKVVNDGKEIPKDV